MSRNSEDQAALAAIVSASPDTRDHLIDEFLRTREATFRRQGAKLCVQFRADRNTWFDDFTSLTRVAAYRIIEECQARPEFVEEVRSFTALLEFRSRSSVRKFIDSSAGFSYASGLSAHKQRKVELEKTREELRRLWAREPSDIEIVEETNRRVMQRRKDAKHQALISTVQDLHVSSRTERVEDQLALAAPEADESAISAVERRDLARLTIAECETISATLGQVAAVWMGSWLGDGEQEPPTAVAVAQTVGFSPSSARRAIAEVRGVAARILSERYGVTSTAG